MRFGIKNAKNPYLNLADFEMNVQKTTYVLYRTVPYGRTVKIHILTPSTDCVLPTLYYHTTSVLLMTSMHVVFPLRKNQLFILYRTFMRMTRSKFIVLSLWSLVSAIRVIQGWRKCA